MEMADDTAPVQRHRLRRFGSVALYFGVNNRPIERTILNLVHKFQGNGSVAVRN